MANPSQVSGLDGVTSPATQLPGAYYLVDVPNPAYNPLNPGTTKPFLTRRLLHEDLVAALYQTAVPTNLLRGTAKVVLYADSADAGPFDPTLDRLPTALLCVGTEATVLLPARHKRVLAADPTGPLTVATDGSFLGPTTPARWVLVDDALLTLPTAAAILAVTDTAASNVSVTISNNKLVFTAGPTPAPAQPGPGEVNDQANFFAVPLVAGFPTAGDYQCFYPGSAGNVQLSAVGGYVSGGKAYLPNLTGAIAADFVGIGVAASGSRPAGPFRTNHAAFTSAGDPAPTTPPPPAASGYQATYTSTYPPAA